MGRARESTLATKGGVVTRLEVPRAARPDLRGAIKGPPRHRAAGRACAGPGRRSCACAGGAAVRAACVDGDDRAAPVGGIARAFDQALALETGEGAGHGRSPHPLQQGQLTGRQRPVALDRRQSRGAGRRQGHPGTPRSLWAQPPSRPHDPQPQPGRGVERGVGGSLRHYLALIISLTTTIEILEGYRHRDARPRCRCSASTRATRPAPGASASASCCRSPSSTRFYTVRETVAPVRRYYADPATVDDDHRPGRPQRQARRAHRHAVGRAEAGGRRRPRADRRARAAVPRRADHRLRPGGPARAAGTIRRTACADAGTTVLLTTHYMDEAQHLADRVAIMAGPDRRPGPSEELGEASAGAP